MAFWATVQTWVRHERKAVEFLRLFGYEAYLPMRRQYQTRFRRPIEYRFPLFPGYCFVRITLQWHQLKGCPSVTKLVRNTGSDAPAHIADEVIAAMKARERDGAIDLPNEKCGRKNPRIGDRVMVVTGCARRCGVRRSVCCCSCWVRSDKCGCGAMPSSWSLRGLNDGPNLRGLRGGGEVGAVALREEGNGTKSVTTSNRYNLISVSAIR